ncbi:MAG: NYN domain-containing protein [Phycisphaerales bacterium]|nr:NYN domain-containing protein [Phycisphaerales bacterium]
MLLIDAFNVLHATGVLPEHLAGLELPGLAALVEQSRYAGRPVTFVCDGVRPGAGHAGPSAARIGAASVLYAGGGREADAEIEKIIGSSSFAARLLVVSSDNRIRKAARRRGAAWMKSEAFLKQLAEDAERGRPEPLPSFVHEIPLSPAEVGHWLEVFGMEAGSAPDAVRNSGGTRGGDASSPLPTLRIGDAEHDFDRDGDAEQRAAGEATPEPPSSEARRRPRGMRPKQSETRQPAEQPAEEPRQDTDGPERPAPPRDAQKQKDIDDEALRKLLQDKDLGIDPDDLDMRRWLSGGG